MKAIDCPSCGELFQYADGAMDEKAECRKCGSQLALPPASTAVSAAHGSSEVQEYVPVICEHCSEPYGLIGNIGRQMQCQKCGKSTSLTELDISRIPAPGKPGPAGSIPRFRGDPLHYQAVYASASRARMQRQKFLDQGVGPSLLVAKLLDCQADFYINRELEGQLKLAGAHLQGGLFFFQDKMFDSADLEGSTLDGSIWVDTSLKNARLDGATLRSCSIAGRSKVSGASFRGADLTEGYLEIDEGTKRPLDFTGANLERAKLACYSALNERSIIVTDARMKGCRVPEALLPALSDKQREEVDVMASEERVAAEDQKLAAESNRRFRSIPVLGATSETHSFDANVKTTEIQVTYDLGNVREHVLNDHVNRHLLNRTLAIAGVIAAMLGLGVAVAGHLALGWKRELAFIVPPVAGLVGAIGGWLFDIATRRIYRQQALIDRGWKAGDNNPHLAIVFEHEWREFRNKLR